MSKAKQWVAVDPNELTVADVLDDESKKLLARAGAREDTEADD
jgi:hypothetical protein